MAGTSENLKIFSSPAFFIRVVNDYFLIWILFSLHPEIILKIHGLEIWTKVPHAVDLTMYQRPARVGNYVHLILHKYLRENQYCTCRYSFVEYVFKNSNEQIFSEFLFVKKMLIFPSGTL